MLKELYFQNQRGQPILLFDIFVKNNWFGVSIAGKVG